MKYCTNCGTELKANAKFCTKCGEQIIAPSAQKEALLDANHHNAISIPNADYNASNSFKNMLLGLYVLLNIPLYVLSGGDEQMLGFLFYSLVITILVAVRNKKENTYNWVLKILIGLQLLFVFSIFMTQLDFLFVDLTSTLASIVFFILFLVLFAMLIKGNSR